MADNTILNAGTGGDTIASDDIAGIKHQRVKVQFGADGAATDVSATAPLPVQISDGTDVALVSAAGAQIVDGSGVTQPVSGTVTANLAAGTNNIGDVDVLTVPAPLSTTGGGTEATALRVTIASDSTGLVSVDDNGGSLTVDAPLGTPVNVQVGDGSSSATVRNLAANDALNVAIVDAAGDQITSFGGGTQYTEDAVAVADPQGTAQILVRLDTPATLTSTDGDNVARRGTNYGAAYTQIVTSAGAFVDTFGGGTQYTEGDVDATITGTAAMMEVAGNTLQPVQGTVADGLLVNLGGNNDVTVAGVATAANQLPDGHNVTIDNAAGAAAVNIQDGGNTITVDGTVTVGSITAGDNNIGNVDIVTVPAPLSTTGGGTEATALRVTLANDSTGVVSVDDNGASLTVDYATTGSGTAAGAIRVELPTNGTGVIASITNPVTVAGGAANGSPVSGNPNLIAGRASTAIPADVGADGDAASMWTNRNGAQVITTAPHVGLNSDPWNLVHEAVNYTTAQTSAVVVAGGASEKIVVTKVQIQAYATTAGTAILYFGTGAYSRGTSRAVFDGEFAPSATLKPGVVMDGPFISGTNGDDLMFTSVGNLSITISVWYYVVT